MPPPLSQIAGTSGSVNVVGILAQSPAIVESTDYISTVVDQQEELLDNELCIKPEKRLSLSDIVLTADPTNDESQQMLTIVSDGYQQAILSSAEQLQDTDETLKIVPNIEIEYITCSSVGDEKMPAERYAIHFNGARQHGAPNTFTVTEWPPQQDYDDDDGNCYTTEEFQDYTMEDDIKDDEPIYETEVCTM